jgi:hypothetical protein
MKEFLKCVQAIGIELRVCRQNLHPHPHPTMQKRKINKSAVQAYNNECNIQVMILA